MSHSGVSDIYTYVNSAQRNFHFYTSRATASDSDNEQGYTGTPTFSNESNLEDDSEGGMEGTTDSEGEIEYNYHNHGTSFTTTEDEDDDDEMDVCSSETESEDNEEEQQIINNSNIQNFYILQGMGIFRFPNVNHPSPIYPNSTDATVASSSISSASSASSSASNQQKQSPLRFGFPNEKRARSISNDWPQSIQFGSLEPVNSDISSRPNQNLRSTQLSSSPPLPNNNRSAGNGESFFGFSPDNDAVRPAHHTPISPPPYILGNYSSNRTRVFSANSRSSSAVVTTPSTEPTYARLHSQPPSFFYHRTMFNPPPRRNFNQTVPQPVEPRRPTSTPNHNVDEQQGYSSNFAPASPDIPIVMYPEVFQPPERRPPHHHTIPGLSQASRTSPTSSSIPPRWTPRDPRGQVARILGNEEEQDNLTELPENSDSEVNITTSTAVRPQFRPPRRHESRQDNNALDHPRSRTLAALAAATAARTNSTNDGSLSADEQIARRMQAYEYSSIQNTNVLARFLGAGRARSNANRRETTSGSSSSSRNESSRRNASTRGTARLPEILSHERNHHEERGNEPPRSRGHGSRGSQSRNGGRSSSASNYLHHHFIPHYPLLGNLIDSGEIELEDFLDLWPVWGNGIAANPDNYLDEDEFDSSYEGLLRLCERIGDAKPKGVSEDVIKTLPAKTFIMGKSKTAEERCTICLTGYESNDLLRDLPCSHDFHQDCIDSWFKNSDKCPICRRSIVER
ncbi:7830_t:CDS:10 [Funneliformis mosseae]|uniref:7830_t:CDS:1 n=1 Tax=Funneliformis mosseae TaxID=27381 RepID=A0A9N9A4M9_FUNMO|nr:7830_t:CDS:10 [Funneliformis mosseae]